MEDNSQSKFKFGKLMVWVVVAALALTGIIYLVLYVPSYANNKYLIPVRKDFYEKVLWKMFVPDHLPYSVVVREVKTLESGEIEYGYRLIGRFEAIDTESEVLILKDMSGREWRMQYYPYMAPHGVNYRNLMVSEIKIAADKTETSQIAYYFYNKEKPEETKPYFLPGDIVMVLWNERRTLRDILQDKDSGDQPVIPIAGSGVIPIYSPYAVFVFSCLPER